MFIPFVVSTFARGPMRAVVSWRYVLFLSAFLTGLPGVVRAQSPVPADDVAALRAELAALQKQMAELTARVEALQGASPASAPVAEATPAPSPTPAPPPAPVATAAVPPGLAAPEAAGSRPRLQPRGQLQGLQPRHRGHRRLPRRRRQAPGRAPSRRWSCTRPSCRFQAIVDPYARADFFLTFGPDEVGRRGRLHHLPDAARRLPA